jgi:hypothetical protein
MPVTMINAVVCFILSVNTIPRNVFFDNYTVIPPLGRVKALAGSQLYLFAISDNYLGVFEKQTLRLKRAMYFDENITLAAYDQQFDELWISGASGIIRMQVSTYNISHYPVSDNFSRIGVGLDYVYLDGVHDYSIDKRTGILNSVQAFPGDLKWFSATTQADINAYAFLSPYYYYDTPDVSQAPFEQYAITALYDDGLYLYVGTNGYGILKYDKVSWSSTRVIYGPLDSQIRKVRKLDNTYYLLTQEGISLFPQSDASWEYRRYNNEITDITALHQNIAVSFQNRISSTGGGVSITIGTVQHRILSLASDETFIYIGTTSGMYKLYKGTYEALAFGPDEYAVYVVHQNRDYVFAGGEFALYQYDRSTEQWTKALPYGTKDIVEIGDDLYVLGLNNQLLRYTPKADADTNWTMLPYFNINDIDTDGSVVYCASFAGAAYYDPETDLYKIIYALPRQEYRYVFVIEDNIVAVSQNNILSLPGRYRD